MSTHGVVLPDRLLLSVPTARAGFWQRRPVYCALFAFAAFAVGLALLLPTFVYPRLAQLPDDPDATQVQTATGATVIVPDLSSSTGMRQYTDAKVTSTTHISGSRGSGSSVVWQLATRVQVAGHGLLTAQVERVSLDRRTTEPTNCCGDSLATDEAHPAGQPLVHSGYLKFPFGVQKRDYPSWDVTLRRPRMSVFDGETSRHGLTAYRFVTANSWLPVGTQELPGSLFGSSAPSVTAVSEYADTRISYVEPATGGSLGLEEQVAQRFRYGDRTLTAMSADLVSPPPTAAELSQLRSGALLLPWVRFRASVVLFALAAVAAFAALLLLRRRSDNPGAVAPDRAHQRA